MSMSINLKADPTTHLLLPSAEYLRVGAVGAVVAGAALLVPPVFVYIWLAAALL